MTGNFRPSIWFRSVLTTRSSFWQQNHCKSVSLQYLNSRHKNIKFTIEFEENNEILFLDILVKHSDSNKLSTSVYKKKTFTGLYTKWDSFTPRRYKINLICSLTYRHFRICSSPELLQSDLKELRKLLICYKMVTL